LSRETLPRAGPPSCDRGGAREARRAPGVACRGGVTLRRARRAEGDRAGEGTADGEGAAQRRAGIRAAAEGEPGFGASAQGDRRGGGRDTRRRVSETEHPNAALVRRLFAAFGHDPMAVSAAFARDVVWRVPGNTVMSGEYPGR